MTLKDTLWEKINQKTKPPGSLGTLEWLAVQIGLIQQSLTPVLRNPHIVVFAGDHGIAEEGISAYPQEVTHQMVKNFLSGGAAINVFCNLHKINLCIIDAGVNYDFSKDTLKPLDYKISKGTRSFLSSKAMSTSELEQSIKSGGEIVEQITSRECNVIGFGEMGIGNTSAASMLMSYICGLPLEQCVGRGTGLNDAQLLHKLNILRQAQTFHGEITHPLEILQTFGGFEMALMCGAFLRAFEKNMVILIDGFVASSVFLVAHRIQPRIMENAIFCHLSSEQGHALMLDYLQAKPLLQLQLRLGEGTGCALAYPIIESAVAFLNEMASFSEAGISAKH
ncbi:MAG: nicotinate-nucleotide--dimethylbenzimidazole phosphoribosyltransferase [Chitinophagales bacterium]|nr:nicotinate-nucleotide--dimethylbenzimidazole phosphoribosyltransferase [Chitinophagales bacterium]MDW8273240.1 nicotinate-nucleotide--dimethylbenzimidazole phosphoribosyltransferase [Chitinophagales bacterium]